MGIQMYDVVVVGGGALGAGIAWQLALSGLSVALVEKDVLGINEIGLFDSLALGRYYRNIEEFKTVRKWVVEMEKRSLGLFRRREIKITDEIDLSQFEEEGLSFRVEEDYVSIYDYILENYLFTLACAQKARELGASVNVLTEVVDFLKEETHIYGIVVYNKLEKSFQEIRGKEIVLAVNAWTNNILSYLGLNVDYGLKKIVNVVFKSEVREGVAKDYRIIPLTLGNVIVSLERSIQSPEELYLTQEELREAEEILEKEGGFSEVIGYSVSVKPDSRVVVDHALIDEYYGITTVLTSKLLELPLIFDELAKILSERLEKEITFTFKPLPGLGEIKELISVNKLPKVGFYPLVQV